MGTETRTITARDAAEIQDAALVVTWGKPGDCRYGFEHIAAEVIADTGEEYVLRCCVCGVNERVVGDFALSVECCASLLPWRNP